MEKPSLEIGNSNWAIKEGELLGYNRAGNDYLPIPITMTRASLGTRVNPEGLVEDVELLGSEEITDGNFPLPNTAWVLSPTFTIADNKLHCVSDGSYQYANQSAMVVGKTYRITFDITGWVSGNIRVRPSGQSPFQTAGSNGSYIFYYTAISNSVLTIERNGTPTDLYIENISVKEATIENLARVDYDGTASSLLVEPMRTNLLTYSEDFSSGIWGNYNSTVTSSVTTAPDGLLSGSKFSGTADVTAHTLFLNAYTVVASNDYTYSVFAKKNESNFIQINTGSGFSNLYANFDLDNGVVGNFNTLDANIESYSNGWFKCSVKANSSTTTGQTTFSIIESLTDARNPSFNALNKSVYIWGAQLEEGSYATSYIPTSGSTVTRNQDIFTRDGIGSLINSTEGVLFVEMAALSLLSDVSRVIMLTSSDGLNYVNIYFQSNGKLTVYNNVNGVNTVLFEQVLNDITLFNKCALKWGSQGYELWANGIKLESSTSTSVPIGLSEINFNWNGGIRHFYGKVKQLQVYKTALTDDELTILTGTSGVHFFPSYASMASDLTYTIE